MTKSSRRLLAATPFIILAAFAARADDPAGVLWETTSQMVLEGMPMSMPPRTIKLCASAQMTRPPTGGDKSCVAKDFVRQGNKATWSVECGGQMPMKGTGEITFDADGNYAGTIKGTAEGIAMTINLSGRKIGTCDKPVD
jgi:Protein of unknown function (DUF3617)